MNTVAIDYIWRVILESERSDEFQFMDDELRVKAEADRLARLRAFGPARAAAGHVVPTLTTPDAQCLQVLQSRADRHPRVKAYDVVTQRCIVGLTIRPPEQPRKQGHCCPHKRDDATMQRCNARSQTARRSGEGASEEQTMFETLVLAGLFVSVPAALPVWPYSRRWGFRLAPCSGWCWWR